jgi:hypothetical protein
LPLSLKMVRTTSAAASDLLLDTYTGASAAYSVRKLDKDYTGYCIKVREDSGDTEADIGFDGSGDLDTAAIATHCGSANGYVVTWYDQSGNANNATQSTAGNQPQIYNGTAVITENGKPALNAAALQRFDVSNTPALTDFTVTIVSKKSGSNTGIIAYDNGSGYIHPTRSNGAPYMEAFVSPTKDVIFETTLGNTSAVGSLGNSQILTYGYRSGTSADAGTNGEVNTTATVGTDAFTLRTLLDYGGNSSFSFAGTVQEMVFWSSSKNSNRTDIESDINTYFSIY